MAAARLPAAGAALWGLLLTIACSSPPQDPPAAAEPQRADPVGDAPAGPAAAPAPDLPELAAVRFDAPPKLDGTLDEPAWARAPRTDAFVHTLRGGRGALSAHARTGYDADALYIAFEVDDDYLKSHFTAHDQHLWEQDCVEVMLDPDGDGRNYFEMQVSPRGVRFDTRYDSRRQPRPFGDVGWDSRVQAGVDARGQIDDDAADAGYTVEMRIPFSALRAGPQPTAAPRAGDTWRMNLFVMDARPQGVRAVGWSAPRVGDFHTLTRFGRLQFAPAKP